MRLDGFLDRIVRQWRAMLSALAGLVLLGTLAGQFSGASGDLRKTLVGLGLGAPAWLAATIAFALAAGLFMANLRQRDARRRLIRDYPLLRFGQPEAGVKRCSRYPISGEEDYVRRRELEADLGDALARDQWIVVHGDELSGVTRVAYEAIHRHWTDEPHIPVFVPALHGVNPSTEVRQLLAATLPWRLVRGPCVLWLDDFGATLLDSDATYADLEAFISRHGEIRVVATMRSEHWNTLRDSGQKRFREKARDVSVPRHLTWKERTEAARKYPELSPDELARLPESRLASKEIAVGLDAADFHVVERACALASVDWVRCGADFPAPESFIREVAPIFVAGARREFTIAEVDAALQQAAKPVAGNTAMLTREGEEGWLPNPAAVRYVEGGGEGVPIEVWLAVVRHCEGRPETLIAVGRRARDRGLRDIVEAVADSIAGSDDDLYAQLAADLDIQTRGEDGATAGEELKQTSELLAAAGNQRAVDVLTAKSPPPMDDNAVPTVRGKETLSQRLYRYRAIRFVLRTIVLMVLDAGSSLVGLLAAILAKAGLNGTNVADIIADRWTLAFFCVGFAIPCLVAAGAYRTDSRRAELDRIVLAFSCAAALAGVTGLAHGEGVIYSTTAWASFIFAMPFCYGARRGYDGVSRWWVRERGLSRRTLLIGRPDDLAFARRRLEREAGRPLVIVGYLATGPGEVSGLRQLGEINDLAAIIGEQVVHHVVVVGPTADPASLLEVLTVCTAKKVAVHRTMTLTEMQVSGRRVALTSSLPIERIAPAILAPSAVAIKRVVDVVGATALLIVCGIPMLLIAGMVRLSTKGSPLAPAFRPKVGAETTFPVRKFRIDRTYVDADQRLRRRLTRFGRLLQRTKLDELPQLLNVLEGSMSLVGPRPLPGRQVARMQPWHLRRYVVKPGVTGLWQISKAAAVLDLDECCRMDLLYVNGWSLWRDFEILIRTPFAVCRGALSLGRRRLGRRRVRGHPVEVPRDV